MPAETPSQTRSGRPRPVRVRSEQEPDVADDVLDQIDELQVEVEAPVEAKTS